MNHRYQAVVLGMGPAGMAAAIELSRAGVVTAIIDQALGPGGQVYSQPPTEFIFPSRLRKWRHKIGNSLLTELARSGSSLRILQGAVIWGAFAPGFLSIRQSNRTFTIGYDKLIICEGAQERVIPCPGWTLPGVFTIGGLRKMVATQGIVPQGRVLLAGSGPLLVGTGADLVRVGIGPIGWYEAVPFRKWASLGIGMLKWPQIIPESLSYLKDLLIGRVRLNFGWGLKCLSGDVRVKRATMVRLDDKGAPIPGSEKRVPVDVVGIGSGLIPTLRLTRLVGCRIEYDWESRCFRPEADDWGQSSQPGIYLAGDGFKVGGADWSEVQGRLAGLHAAWSLNHIDSKKFSKNSHVWQHTKRMLGIYRKRYHEVFTPQDGHFQAITPETIVCRCEGVTFKDILTQIIRGDCDLTALKTTRLGMGPCQGRVCENIATEFLRINRVPHAKLNPLNLRPPLTPLPLSAFGKLEKENEFDL